MKYLSRSILLLLLSLLVIGTARAQTSNLLIDPGFEGETYNVISIDPTDGTRFHVPAGWSGGIVRTPGSAPWINAHPNGFPHTAGFKIQGNRSFHMSRGGATFTAYIYQQVAVQPNSPVQGGSWAYIENSKSGQVRAGIDPTGGTDPFGPNVVWSSWAVVRNGWTQVSASTTAQGGVVTLFLYATQDIPTDPNGVYWDDAFVNGIPGVMPIQAGAAPATRPMVTADANLRVRRGPGIDQPRIGAMNAGESYPLVEDQGNWYAIDFNGQTGYVSAQYTHVGAGSGSGGGQAASAGAPVATGASIDYIVDYTLRMRAAPGRDSAEVAVIPYTATVQAVARSADHNWLLVNYEGRSGWVAAWVGRLQGSINSLPVR
ncbi:MAG: SH3 domain-containing protein [Anaerolineae bacterium]|nr:SH3 domain-containing protein [Anaerolineae bacterium]